MPEPGFSYDWTKEDAEEMTRYGTVTMIMKVLKVQKAQEGWLYRLKVARVRRRKDKLYPERHKQKTIKMHVDRELREGDMFFRDHYSPDITHLRHKSSTVKDESVQNIEYSAIES